MTKTNSATTVAFLGPMAQGIVWDEPEMVKFIQQHAMALTNASVKVYVADRDENESLHWQVVVVSPRGRQSYVAVQRHVGSPIYVTKDF